MSIELIDVTRSAGIKFVHFKGNQGISVNLEEFRPGVCVSDYDPEMAGKTSTLLTPAIVTTAKSPSRMPSIATTEMARLST